jgi:hypothetical protein
MKDLTPLSRSSCPIRSTKDSAEKNSKNFYPQVSRAFGIDDKAALILTQQSAYAS